MESIKQPLSERLTHPAYLVVEFIILVTAGYNFTVTARFQGWESLDPTIKAGAVVFALIVDGGLFTSLFLMRDAHYREKEQRATQWKNWAILFGAISCLMALLFNGSHWQPDTVSAASWVGVLLSWVESSGTALILKSVVPILALYPLAMFAPVKRQSLEEVKTDSAIAVTREEAKTRIEELKRRRDPKAADREAKDARRRLLICLRAELTKAGTRRVERLSDEAVMIQAAAKGIYDPATDTITEYVPKPAPPFNQVLEIALEHGLVSQDEWEEAQEYKGEYRNEWQAEVRQRVEDAGKTPDIVQPHEAQAALAAPARQALLPVEAASALPSIAVERLPETKAPTEPEVTVVAASQEPPFPRKSRYNLTEAADICGIQRSTFEYWVRQRKYKCRRPRDGKTPWFDYEQMVAAYQETTEERARRTRLKAEMKGLQPVVASPAGDQSFGLGTGTTGDASQN